MLQLFKKVTGLVSVKKIHNDFYSAHKTLLSESDRIAKELLLDAEKEEIANAVYKMRFFNAKNIVNPIKAIELKKHLVYYQQEYPFNKFITEDVVEKICNKYNLYLCSVTHYKGDIPFKNQVELVNFRVKEKDFDKHHWMQPLPAWESRSDLMEKWRAKMNQLKQSEKLMAGACLKIVAPESQIDMTNKEKKGYQIVAKDPIVLQPVVGGYLIVTAWGDEASDEDVVNQKMN